MSKILSSIPGNMSKSIAKYDTIVIGSGLAGLTTTYQLLKAGQKVALLEKSEKLGGNSIKASSGINGVPTKYQKQPLTDSIESFVQDTLKTGKNLNDKKMVDILTKNSRDAIYWLNDEINVDLSNVVLLGGHSHARTHKGDKLPPGFAIVSALTKKLDGFQAENPDQLTILKSSTLTKILTEGNKVKGIEFTDSEKQPQEMYADNVVLATGGFSADFDSPTSLLQKYRPDLLGFPLSNGAQTTGDGQKIAERNVNAELIHMDKVQVHPTGFMKVSNPNENWKFLCGELMRGIGGILLSPVTGWRFVDELQPRDLVTDAVLKHSQIGQNNEIGLKSDNGDGYGSVIVISGNDYQKATTHIEFYKSQRLLQEGSIEDLYYLLIKLNPKLPLTLDQLKDKFSGCDAIIEGTQQDSLGRTKFGGRFGDLKKLYFGVTTPVVHFTMGGIKVNPSNAKVVTKSGDTISNLFAIGEVSAGVHGNNRLGGSSLLECVVFGRFVSENILSGKN